MIGQAQQGGIAGVVEIWKEAAVGNAAAWILWGGLLIGAVFGFIVQRTNFCTMGSLSDIVSFGDWRRFRSWVLAAGVAIAGVFWLERAGIADMTNSMYVSPSLAWGGHIIGGTIFGIGMVFSGGCVSRNLVRAGSGDLRSLVVLWLVGGVAYMTIGGLFGPARVAVVGAMTADLSTAGISDQRVGSIIAGLTGLPAETAQFAAVVAIVAVILVWCFKDAAFRRSPVHLAAGVGIGLCVVAGWLLTGLTFDEFADNPSVGSLSFVRPAGDSVDYLMRFTAYAAPGFAVVTTLGALLGAFAGAVSQRRFRLATFTDAADTLRNFGGAILMGVGGVVALGCTIGQAVTGTSTLAVGSLITFVCIVIGGLIGLKAMEAMA
ncbi:MAG: YeeE/YedE family protein [Jhaorihella sp.]